MQDDAGLISTGTAFFYSTERQRFLITNWHNVSGRDFITKSYNGKSGRRPTALRIKWATRFPAEADATFTTMLHDVALYSEDMQTPLWFEHPQMGSNCDVIALPIALPASIPEFMHNSANLISKMRIPVRPGCPVFIIGFPENLSVGFGLPVWKSGYIASEPHYDVSLGGQLAAVGGLAGGVKIPAFFIDSLTRRGMSGSPVFASYTGNWDATDPYRDVDPTAPDFHMRDDIALGENRMEFVGVYSGRVPTSEGDAALGLCWRRDVIQMICESRSPARHPHL